MSANLVRVRTEGCFWEQRKKDLRGWIMFQTWLVFVPPSSLMILNEARSSLIDASDSNQKIFCSFLTWLEEFIWCFTCWYQARQLMFNHCFPAFVPVISGLLFFNSHPRHTARSSNIMRNGIQWFHVVVIAVVVSAGLLVFSQEPFLLSKFIFLHPSGLF